MFRKNIPPVRCLGELPDAVFRSLAAKLDQIEDWSDRRSAKFRVHAATRSVELIHSPLVGDFFQQIHRAADFDRFAMDLADVEGFLRRQYRFIDPAICRALLVNLPAGESVQPHRDNGAGLMVGARIHVPLRTAPGVQFAVGDRHAHLSMGHVYEIDNSAVHAVENRSGRDRIHLILDLCDLHQIDRQVAYHEQIVAGGADQPEIGPASAAPQHHLLMRTLRLCGGQIQERLAQRPLPVHLFVLSPNNSGSTLLARLLAGCRRVASLANEGQFVEGFHGPNPITLGVRHVFTERAKAFRDPANYDWAATKNAWFEQWDAAPEGSVLLEKSPTNLLRVPMLRRQFANCRFILLVRHPYAVAEGISRRTGITDFDRIGRHLDKALRMQALHHQRLKEIALLIRYEDLCDAPDAVKERLQRFLPDLADIDFSKTVAVKDYCQPLTNLNEAQICRLPAAARQSVARQLDPATLQVFGYSL